MSLFDPAIIPAPAMIVAARKGARLTQEQAARLVRRNGRKRWSEWETGVNHMKPDTWELFLLLTGQHPALCVVPRQPE